MTDPPAHPDFQPAPNIRDAPDLYELENAALGHDGLVLAAMRESADWSGRTLVDLGCGTGFWLPGYASQAAHVIGIEPDPGLLAAARRRTRPPGARAAVEVLAGSAEHLPLADGSVDVVHARFAYFWGAGAEAGLSEVGRVLREGGTLVVVDNDHATGEFAQLLAAGAGRDQAAIDAWWAARGATRAAVTSQWRFADHADLAAVLANEFRDGTAADWLARHPDRRHITYGFALFAWRPQRSAARR